MIELKMNKDTTTDMRSLLNKHKFLIEQTEKNKNISDLFIKFLWVRDQAHIYHWQTKTNSHHVNLGEFYENYLEKIDELAESIFGKTGKTFTINGETIKLNNFSEDNFKDYLKNITNLFNVEFKKTFPNNNDNVDVYNTLGDILEIINKLKYLSSQK